jgi:hypothetical protein
LPELTWLRLVLWLAGFDWVAWLSRQMVSAYADATVVGFVCVAFAANQLWALIPMEFGISPFNFGTDNNPWVSLFHKQPAKASRKLLGMRWARGCIAARDTAPSGFRYAVPIDRPPDSYRDGKTMLAKYSFADDYAYGVH